MCLLFFYVLSVAKVGGRKTDNRACNSVLILMPGGGHGCTE